MCSLALPWRLLLRDHQATLTWPDGLVNAFWERTEEAKGDSETLVVSLIWVLVTSICSVSDNCIALGVYLHVFSINMLYLSKKFKELSNVDRALTSSGMAQYTQSTSTQVAV